MHTESTNTPDPEAVSWRRKIDRDKRSLSVEDQLDYWWKFLVDRAEAMRVIDQAGCKMSIDCYMDQSNPIIVYFSPEFTRKLSDLLIPVKFTIYGSEPG